jgi:acyl-CoA thioesterase-1
LPLVNELVSSAARRATRVHWLILLLLAATPVWAGAAGKVVLVLGDSLSSAYGMDVELGWVHLLQQRLDAGATPYRVVNASISGDTTGGGATRLPRALATHGPHIVIVELGGNDGLRGVSLDTTRRNLDTIVRLSLESGARVLLVGMRLPPNYGPAYTERFHAQFRKLAEQRGVAHVPFLLEGVGGERALMQDDGIHPRAEAQAMLLDNVWPHLEPLL